MRILVTGSSGLIGGEAVEYFGTRGHEIVGVDNNLRKEFFGSGGDTSWNLHRVAHLVPNYKHHESDIRNGPLWHTTGERNEYPGQDALSKYVFQGPPFDAVIHCAAQPSHDYAAKNPDFDRRVNVLGTENLLWATFKHSPRATFIFMSTNKVYDNAVNAETFVEYPTRLDRNTPWNGFNELTNTGADNPFGQHKLEADCMVQNYGARYGLRTVVLRGGCLTGPGHSGVEAHGFLSYLVRCALSGAMYRVFGYKGKQVRDNIHSYDVSRAMEEIIKRPPERVEVFNIGGGRDNSCSIIEAIDLIERMLGVKVNWEYEPEARVGDHQCYITDLSKLRERYHDWRITRSLEHIIGDIAKTAIDENMGAAGYPLERMLRARDALRYYNQRSGL